VFAEEEAWLGVAVMLRN